MTMRRNLSLSVCVFLICISESLFSEAKSKTELEEGVKNSRRGKLFSIFNVVTFQNLQCTGSSSTSSNRVMGSCLSATECSSKSFSNADGNCASGFGVCCVITISGCSATVTENCTYVQNEGYPSAYTRNSATCTTSITRPSNGNLCQIRLDFENFVTSVSTAGVCGTTQDSFTTTAPFSSSANAFPPTVCGTLTGQHMYFETGASGNAQFSVATGSAPTTSSRTWRIKVTFIGCGDANRAPVSCNQYFTGVTGIVESYGFPGDQQLNSQTSGLCVRQESGFKLLLIEDKLRLSYFSAMIKDTPALRKDDVLFLHISARGISNGYCSIQWSTNPSASDGFDLGPSTTATETTCPAAMLSVDSHTICGGAFSTIVTDTFDGAITSSILPFKLYHFTNTIALTGLGGFSLSYTQVPC